MADYDEELTAIIALEKAHDILGTYKLLRAIAAKLDAQADELTDKTKAAQLQQDKRLLVNLSHIISS